MKLSKIYSNFPGTFGPIEFSRGLNVVLAEIRQPDNRRKDTHNLGKTTLCRLLDFCLLSRRDPKFFLFRHLDRFRDYVFFLEVEIEEGNFVTIRRSVAEPSKISLKRHDVSYDEHRGPSAETWDHQAVSFERARDILDGALDWRVLQPWSFRKMLGYVLRSQDDYGEMFQLRKFASSHSEWKPFLAQILGFDASRVTQHYEIEARRDTVRATAEALRSELGETIEDVSKIEGLLHLKQRDADKMQAQLDAFDFREHDIAKTESLVDEIDTRISELNKRRYVLNQSRKKIASSIGEDKILFDPEQADSLFKEVGVLFPGQLKKDFQQLIAFNKAITEERRGYLREEQQDIAREITSINVELDELGKRRSGTLAYLGDTDFFDKYKRLSGELIALRADIATFERRRVSLHRLQELRRDIRALTDTLSALQADIEMDVERQNSDQASLFSTIRLFFSEIVEEVIDRKALLSVSTNQHGHLEFRAEILDSAGNSTSADLGFTYRKLLCIAFDLAVLRAYLGERFTRFVYHDGALESLDDRKKTNLIQVIRRYASMGLQPVISLIDSDLPPHSFEMPVFSASEICLALNDEGPNGRLFRTDAW